MQLVFKHPSAHIDHKTFIGAGTKVWHNAHISEGAHIGKDCVIGQNVFIGKDVKIGDRCKIQNNVNIYTGVELGDDVFCGPSMTFTNVINPRAFVERKDEFQKTIVKQGVSFGANCTIICGGQTIGEYAFIGAGSVLTGKIKVKPFAVFYGNPAKQNGWISKRGTIMDLPLYAPIHSFSNELEWTCPETKELYRLKKDNMIKVFDNTTTPFDRLNETAKLISTITLNTYTPIPYYYKCNDVFDEELCLKCKCLGYDSCKNKSKELKKKIEKDNELDDFNKRLKKILTNNLSRPSMDVEEIRKCISVEKMIPPTEKEIELMFLSQYKYFDDSDSINNSKLLIAFKEGFDKGINYFKNKYNIKEET